MEAKVEPKVEVKTEETKEVKNDEIKVVKWYCILAMTKL